MLLLNAWIPPIPNPIIVPSPITGKSCSSGKKAPPFPAKKNKTIQPKTVFFGPIELETLPAITAPKNATNWTITKTINTSCVVSFSTETLNTPAILIIVWAPSQ